ncbi:hypothetical protein BKA63DRAFT_322779 [Paraphoma chrysanthemicola]|nr:hypothetical protein BKA63DRAFT_322779 [Paraphoma chrysanthemicola]
MFDDDTFACRRHRWLIGHGSAFNNGSWLHKPPRRHSGVMAIERWCNGRSWVELHGHDSSYFNRWQFRSFDEERAVFDTPTWAASLLAGLGSLKLWRTSEPVVVALNVSTSALHSCAMSHVWAVYGIVRRHASRHRLWNALRMSQHHKTPLPEANSIARIASTSYFHPPSSCSATLAFEPLLPRQRRTDLVPDSSGTTKL